MAQKTTGYSVSKFQPIRVISEKFAKEEQARILRPWHRTGVKHGKHCDCKARPQSMAKFKTLDAALPVNRIDDDNRDEKDDKTESSSDRSEDGQEPLEEEEINILSEEESEGDSASCSLAEGTCDQVHGGAVDYNCGHLHLGHSQVRRCAGISTAPRLVLGHEGGGLESTA